MSEENHKKADESPDEGSAGVAEPRDEAYEVTFKKSTGELVIKDPKSGHSMTVRGKVDETVEEEDKIKPLTPAQFRDALERVDSLGLTWTADSLPSIKAKKDRTDVPMFGEELTKLQREYPHLPRELSLIVTHALTGSKVPAEHVGNIDDLKQKAEIVRELVITPEYKSEFFFKHSIKVPYLADTDWEVVFKLAEKNVKKLPGVSYALLSLIFHYPSISGGPRKHENITVAVNNDLVNKLINDLNKIKRALEYGAGVTKNVHGLSLKDAEDNVGTTPKELE